MPLRALELKALQEGSVAQHKPSSVGKGRPGRILILLSVVTAFLFAAAGARRWGAFDASTGETRLHKERDFGDGDLLDFAAVQTLLNKGTVYVLNSNDMPGGTAVATVFRY